MSWIENVLSKKRRLFSLIGFAGPLWWAYGVVSRLRFTGSADYWERRYSAGRNSGSGSYGRLAQFKAQFLNDYVKRHSIESVVEFGCGDGGQLMLAEYPSYTGVDVSNTAIEYRRSRFKADSTKRFFTLDGIASTDVTADLALSLDVIYHLVEDEVFESHMIQLFKSAERAVIVYSSNEEKAEYGAHIRHRRFTDWVDRNTDWILTEVVKNPYPYDRRHPHETTWANFYVFLPPSE